MRPRTSIAPGWLWALSIVAALLATTALYAFQRHAGPGGDPLVVYCAHDAVYAEAILQRFSRETGIPLSIRYDTEATKSLSLVELILREGKSPRCDVFWNNQLVGTDQLKKAGLLEPYKGPGYERIPEKYRDPEGCWTGFAARLRVYIVNTRRVQALASHGRDLDGAIAEILDGDLTHVAMAKPLYGTTLTHYAVMWRCLGPEGVRKWRADKRERGLVEVAGNAAVKDLVARGVCDLGVTDTDDFFEALDSGAAVAMAPVQTLVPKPGTGKITYGKVGGPDANLDLNTICIPNTVAIIRGARHVDAARRLVDYLLSERVELSLAASNSRQIPLGPCDLAKLPLNRRSELATLTELAAQAYDLRQLGDAPDRCLEWLKAEYQR